MTIRIVDLHSERRCVDLGDLQPRIARIITIVLRDAEMINASPAGSLTFNFSRGQRGESIKSSLTMHSSS